MNEKIASLTPLQRRHLRVYLRFREQPVTISGLLWANRRNYFLLLALFGTIAVAFYHIFGAIAAEFLGVVFAVAVLRDIGFYRNTAAVWPVLRQVLDWEKIRELADSEETPAGR